MLPPVALQYTIQHNYNTMATCLVSNIGNQVWCALLAELFATYALHTCEAVMVVAVLPRNAKRSLHHPCMLLSTAL